MKGGKGQEKSKNFLRAREGVAPSHEGDAYIRALGKLQSSEIAFTITFSSTGRRCPSNNPAT
jgi:hypothetical protein